MESERPGRSGTPRPHASAGFLVDSQETHAGGGPRAARVAARSAAPKGPPGGRPRSGERGQGATVGTTKRLGSRAATPSRFQGGQTPTAPPKATESNRPA